VEVEETGDKDEEIRGEGRMRRSRELLWWSGRWN